MSKWEWKKLGEVYDFTRGLTYSKKDEIESSSNCILRSNNIDLQTNSINLDELKYIKDEIAIPQEKYVRKNTILICMSNGSKAHLGKVAYIDKDYDFAFGGFMGLLKPKCEINGKFVHLYLCSDEYKNFIKSLSDGANINNLKFDDLRKFEIPFPPLSEQNRIVKFLDEEFSKIDTLKTNAETNLKNARQLFKAGLEKAFQGKNFWKKMLLEDVCSNIVDCPHTTPKKVSYQTNYPCIRTSELKCGEIDWKSMQYLDEKEYKKRIARLEPKENDIVYGREGTFGDAVLLPNTHRFSLGQRTMLFRPDLNFVIPRFLLLSIISPYVYKQAQEKNNGCGVGHVNVGDIKKFNVFIPPFSVQKEIVARLDKLSENVKRLEANYKQIIANCDELKKTTLKQTFKGGN